MLVVLPNNEDAIVARGDAFFTLGRLQDFRKEYFRLTQLRPHYPLYWQRLGAVDAARGESEVALSNLRKALELQLSLLSAINDILFVYIRSKQYDAAFADLDRVSRTTVPKDGVL